MRTAEQVLGIIHDRGKRGLPLEDVYRQLYNPDLFLRAYGKIYRNTGAMTKGTTDETVDGMSAEKIRGIIALLREEKYRWTPVRRVYIEKQRSTKKRPLGIPTWSDKLLQEVLRSILEAYYEPQFSDHSHGFRPGRGCHTALDEVYRTWKGTTWFIEGDITGCFDTIDHAVLLAIIAEKLHDNRLLRLLKGLLEAGYLEDWRYHRTLSGTPQGGVVSPLLANIYLDRLDHYIAGTLVPQYTRGATRKPNPRYRQQMRKANHLRRAGRDEEAAASARAGRRLPSKLTDDPTYRRLRFVRYADDFLLGFIGPHEEAQVIKGRLATFLRDTLKLDLAAEKTLITHARTKRARFLGYDVSIAADNTRRTAGQRTLNGAVTLTIPPEVVQHHCARYTANGIPIHRAEMLNDEVFSIVAHYQATYRGLVEYYRLAVNLGRLSKLAWTMETSLTKTLAHKLNTSVPTIYRRYHTTVENGRGRVVKALQVQVERPGKRPLVATWGGVSLARDVKARLNDTPAGIHVGRTELVRRLQAEECELCGSTDRIEVHHIRKLADLKKHGRTPPGWVQVMAARQRKTLILCHTCHTSLHAGRPTSTRRESPGEPDDAKVSRPVRRGADGKVLG